MRLWQEHPSHIPTAPLRIVCVALALSALPLLGKIAPWATTVFAVAILLRLYLNRERRPLPGLPLKIVLLALGLGGVAFTSGGLLGVEPGLGILFILISLKLLETNTVRDFQVLVLLGWFLCLCGLFFSQDLTTWLYLGSIALLLTASLVLFHRAPQRGGFGASLGLALKLLAQALPIIVLCFLFFPRVHGGFRFQFSRSVIGVTGMSDRLSPGSFAALTQDDSLAFRVEFPDGNIPSLSQLYWRGGVLWRGEGLTWVRGPQEMTVGKPQSLAGTPIRQRIILEPHGGRWIFALDRPAESPRTSFRLQPGGYYLNSSPVFTRLSYEVVSRPENRETSLPPDQHREALRKPARISPQVQALVDSWRSAAVDDSAVVEAALRHFRKEKFVYSLEPNTYGDDALTEFLFERRIGFCEHYAAAFASLMRIAGIPSRIVVGYQGGQLNAIGKYLNVRQLDAHAWAEVWIADTGWQRVDPTSVIAPDRISSGSFSFLEGRASGDFAGGDGSSLGAAGLRDLFREATLVWDNLKYQWDLRVINYDEETQRTFLAFVGLGEFTPSNLLIWTVIGALLFLGLLGIWLRRPARRSGDPLVREYARFCARLAAAGVARAPNEGPQHFAERAARALPAHAGPILDATRGYVRARYAQEPAAFADFRRAVRTLPSRATLRRAVSSR